MKTLAVLVLAFGAVILCTAGTSTDPVPVQTAQTVTADDHAANGKMLPVDVKSDKETNVVADDVNPAVLITAITTGAATLIGSIAGLVHAARKFRQNKIDDYVEEAKEAERVRDAAIVKQHHAEEERDDLAIKLDAAQKNLLERKNYFHQELVDKERQYRQEIQKLHEENRAEVANLRDTLLMETHTRYDREKLLASNGIAFHHAPPPYTEKMKREVTAEDHKRVDEALSTGTLPEVEKNS